jgi:hypothetical protein
LPLVLLLIAKNTHTISTLVEIPVPVRDCLEFSAAQKLMRGSPKTLLSFLADLQHNTDFRNGRCLEKKFNRPIFSELQALSSAAKHLGKNPFPLWKHI